MYESIRATCMASNDLCCSVSIVNSKSIQFSISEILLGGLSKITRKTSEAAYIHSLSLEANKVAASIAVISAEDIPTSTAPNTTQGAHASPNSVREAVVMTKKTISELSQLKKPEDIKSYMSLFVI